jgi:drug/metabolite transporter (DMT)-like permease
MKIFFYTSFALVAFSLNSILCRLALETQAIDAASFTSIRLLSGAIMLLAINTSFGNERTKTKDGNWLSAFFLFSYAFCFSFAYVGLSAGTGALILFGCVQMTMIAAALFSGERPRTLEWLGLIFALAGLICLVFPNLSAPSFFHSALMAIAGVSWGFYTMQGRGSINPLGDTSGNFVRTIPLVVLASLPFLIQFHSSQLGILLAVLSGAITSGIGYALWYAALKFHTATRAAILQLSVPVLTAFIGVIFLSETVSMRLLWTAVLIVGGIGLAILSRKYDKNKILVNQN